MILLSASVANKIKPGQFFNAFKSFIMKKYKLPLFLSVLFFLSIANYSRMSGESDIRTIEIVQLVGIGFLAGIIVMQFIMISKGGNSKS